MNQLILISLFSLLSCSHDAGRSIASKSRPTNLNIDPDKSSVHLVESNKFMLVVKNDLNEEMEISSTDVKVKNAKGKTIPFQLERVGAGKYYVLPLTKEQEFQVSIQDKLIGKKLKVSLTKPHISHSGFTVLARKDNVVSLQLKLADKSGRPVLGDEIPEILMDGEGSIEDLKSQGNGLWSFNLLLPEINIILYLSVRSHGVYLERIFRLQHVEK